jgi:PAS domain S-box-containing protein
MSAGGLVKSSVSFEAMAEDELTLKLTQSNDWFRALFEQSPMGVFVFDTAMRLTACNARFVQILQTSADAVVGLDLARLRDQSVVPALRSALLGTLSKYEGPYRATTSAARVIISMVATPLRDLSGEVIGATGIVEDVTARVRAQEALVGSETRFRELIEHLPDAVTVYRDGTVIFANLAMVRSLGYESAEDLVGKELLELIHPSDRRLVIERGARALLGEANPPVELRVTRKDGSHAFAEIVSMAIDYDGAPAFLSVARDTTERRVMQAELLQADRMASVGTLAAGVAHEINNPLAYLKGNLDALATRKLNDIIARVDSLAQEALRAGATPADVEALKASLDEAKEMVRLAREGADQMRAIVADLKTFSRSDDAPSSWVDLPRVLDAAIHMAWSEVRTRAIVQKSYGATPSVYANESRLAQVFLNVILNAAHAIPEGRQGVIRVTTATGAAGEAIVEIVDDGAGMKPEVAARIFDPFFTTKASGSGTGLGLWICQGIVSALGGRIEVASEPGRGATFTIVIPQREIVASEPRIAIKPATRRGGTVLVLDDQREILRLIERALGHRYTVECYEDGEAALAKIASGATYALVLCDMSMPRVNGMQLYERAIQADERLRSRFIFLTGAATDQRAHEFLKAHSHLMKPFELAELIDVVEAHMTER